MPSAPALTMRSFHAGKWLPDGVRSKRFEVVDGDRGASFRQAIAIRDRDAEIVKELKRLRLRERAADNDRAEFAAERIVDLLQQAAAEAKPRAALR